MNRRDIARMTDTYTMTAFFAVVVALLSVREFFCGDVVPTVEGKGLLSTSAQLWPAFGTGSLWLSLSLNMLVMALLIYVNKTFNLIRGVRSVHALLFVVLQVAVPELLCQFYGGTLLCVTVVAASALLFSSFGDRSNASFNVLLAFFLVSAGALAQYAFVPYLLVLLVGCGQMKIFGLRTFLAAVMGVAAPVWLLYGFSLAAPEDFSLPQFSSIFESIGRGDALHLVVVFVLVLLATLVSCMLNAMKIVSYNAKARAFSGYMLFLTLVTMVASVVDYTNMITYLPLLNACAAFQLSHVFMGDEQERGGVYGVVATVCVAFCLYVVNVCV